MLAGVVLSAAISSRRTGIWRESSAIAVLAVVAMSYVSLDFAGGSGYLGAFLAGLIVGNMRMLGLSMHDEHSRDLMITSRSLADIVTIFVFVLVGANLPFHALGQEILPALAVVAVLLLVARPVTVAICMLPDRRSGWSRAELAFVCWTRETGVVPAALVGVLAALSVPNGDLLASVVALAILVTLAVQADPGPVAGAPARTARSGLSPHTNGPNCGLQTHWQWLWATLESRACAESSASSGSRPWSPSTSASTSARCSPSSTTAAPTAPAWPSTATPRRRARARSRSSRPIPATSGARSATAWPRRSAATPSPRCARATRSSWWTPTRSVRRPGCATATPSCGS